MPAKDAIPEYLSLLIFPKITCRAGDRERRLVYFVVD